MIATKDKLDQLIVHHLGGDGGIVTRRIRRSDQVKDRYLVGFPFMSFGELCMLMYGYHDCVVRLGDRDCVPVNEFSTVCPQVSKLCNGDEIVLLTEFGYAKSCFTISSTDRKATHMEKYTCAHRVGPTAMQKSSLVYPRGDTLIHVECDDPIIASKPLIPSHVQVGGKDRKVCAVYDIYEDRVLIHAQDDEINGNHPQYPYGYSLICEYNLVTGIALFIVTCTKRYTDDRSPNVRYMAENVIAIAHVAYDCLMPIKIGFTIVNLSDRTIYRIITDCAT